MKSQLLPEQRQLYSRIKNLMLSFKKSKADIRPHFFVTGRSGTGKSHLVATVASEMGFGFIEVNAAQITVEGVAGNSLSKALAPIRNHIGKPCVVFVDEMDKVLIDHEGESTFVRAGVQDEFLKCLESDRISVFGEYGKYNEIPSNNVLFVFAGAFGGRDIHTVEALGELGVRTEFLGRVSIVLSTTPISLDSIMAAIPKHPLLLRYLEIYPHVKGKDAIEAISKGVKADYEKHGLGMRMIASVTHKYFMDKEHKHA